MTNDFQSFITLVNQILTAKQKDPNADTSALERQIDKMVYALYDLTPEEISIVYDSSTTRRVEWRKEVRYFCYTMSKHLSKRRV